MTLSKNKRILGFILSRALYSIMTDTIHYLTKAGHQKLKDELAELAIKQRENSQRIKEAIEMGDLSENAEYSDAKDQQAFLAGRKAEIEAILKNVEIIDEKASKTGEVRIGSTIKVKSPQIEKTFTIVGAEEANPSEGLISHESPLGRAFLGHKKGDKVDVETPGGAMQFKIQAVE